MIAASRGFEKMPQAAFQDLVTAPGQKPADRRSSAALPDPCTEARMFKMTIGARVLLAVAVPSLALLLAAGVVILDAQATSSRAAKLEAGLMVVAEGGDLIHLLQRERGLSAGHVGSRGQGGFEPRLAEARGDTDAQLAEMRAARAAYAGTTALPEVAAAADEALAALESLAQVRARVSALEIERAEAAGWYTSAIRRLIGAEKALDAGLSGEDEVRGLLSAYVALAEAKEAAGLERAMGSVGFGSGVFTRDVYERFFGLGVRQRTYFETFLQEATPALSTRLRAILDGPMEERLAEMREAARMASSGFGTDSVSGPDWFEASTARIDALKSLENEVQSLMLAQAAASRSRAGATMLAEVALVLVAVSIAVGAGLVVSRNVSRGLRELGDAVQRASRGEDVEIAPALLERSDEIGIFARNAQDVQFATDRARRIIGALDAVDAPVAVSNQRRGVTYANPAFRRLAGEARAALSAQGVDPDTVVGAAVDDLLPAGVTLEGFCLLYTSPSPRD